MNENIGWLFYRDYYENLLKDAPEFDFKNRKETAPNLDWKYVTETLSNDEKDKLKAHNAALLECKNKRITSKAVKSYQNLVKDVNGKGFNPLDLVKQEVVEKSHTFSLKTTYPGLLTGSGYQHGINAEGEFKLGFFFDHTTGLPILTGSSIKGVLRSVFPDSAEEGKPERKELIKWILSDVNQSLEEEFRMDTEKLDIEAFEHDVFSGKRRLQGSDDKWEYHLSQSQRDVFFDAYIVKGGKGDFFLDKDFITPHINREHPEMSPFSDPNPLQFLKVRPEVTFVFQLKLSKSDVNGISVSPEFKKALFKKILQLIGAGAKTNVGYGQFADPEAKVQSGGGHPPIPPTKSGNPKDYKGKIKEGVEIQAKVIDPDEKMVEIIVDGKSQKLKVFGNCRENLGELIRVEIKLIQKNKKTRINIITGVGYLGPLKK